MTPVAFQYTRVYHSLSYSKQYSRTDAQQVRNGVEHRHVHQDCQNVSANQAERIKHL